MCRHAHEAEGNAPIQEGVYSFCLGLKEEMATLSDKAVGTLMILISLLVFIYYTVWVIVLPFVEVDHVVHSYFLPRWYAIAIPVVAGVILLALIGSFVSIVLIKDSARKRAKSKKTN